eukprot:2822280-Rhodomonas_salina.2
MNRMKGESEDPADSKFGFTGAFGDLSKFHNVLSSPPPEHAISIVHGGNLPMTSPPIRQLLLCFAIHRHLWS